jgi:hypothetical protein
MFGWSSDTSAQTLETDLLARAIFDESPPPSSSKTTSRFLLGCSQDLGTWYLHIYHSFSLLDLARRSLFRNPSKCPLTNAGWAGRSLLGTWVPGRSRCSCTLCSPRLHTLSSSVQCFVRLSRPAPCPCCPYPKPMARPRWESRSKPTNKTQLR